MCVADSSSSGYHCTCHMEYSLGNDNRSCEAQSGFVRTVIFVRRITSAGERIYLRGGKQDNSVAVSYANLLDQTEEKQADTHLDWASNSLLDWTTSAEASPWHVANGIRYNTYGYGVDDENLWGSDYWKFDVLMEGAVGDEFDVKAVLVNGAQEVWEHGDNHKCKVGYITFWTFGHVLQEEIALSGGNAYIYSEGMVNVLNMAPIPTALTAPPTKPSGNDVSAAASPKDQVSLFCMFFLCVLLLSKSSA